MDIMPMDVPTALACLQAAIRAELDAGRRVDASFDLALLSSISVSDTATSLTED